MELRALDYVVLVVEDLDRSIAFYAGALGLELGHRAARYAQFRTGETRLGLYERDAMAETLGIPIAPPDPGAPAFEIGFEVEDVVAAFAELVGRGAIALTPPSERPWGQKTAYIRDPDGHLIELVEERRTG